MLRKISTVFLAVTVLFAGMSSILGQETAVLQDRKIKAQVNGLGAGAKVTVFLKDGTMVRGSIGQILDDSFDVTIKDQTQSSIISYRDVTKVKKRGWTNSGKIGVGVAIGAGAIAVALLLLINATKNSSWSIGSR